MENYARLLEARRNVRNGDATAEDRRIVNAAQRLADKRSSKVYWESDEEKARVQEACHGKMTDFIRTMVLRGLNSSSYSKDQVEELQTHLLELRRVAEERLADLAESKHRERELMLANADLTSRVAGLHDQLSRFVVTQAKGDSSRG